MSSLGKAKIGRSSGSSRGFQEER